MGFAARLKGFTGGIPKRDYRLLPEGAASKAADAFFTSGRIDPMFAPYQISATLSSLTAGSMYRMTSGGVDSWLSWDSDVDVVRSPISGDTSYKISYTSDAYEPRQTNLAMATSAAQPYPNTWYVLGVSPPITKLAIGLVTGGTVPTESRAYLYTFVTQWGEESAPAPVATSTVDGNANGSWALSAMQVAPTNNGVTTTTVSYNSVSGVVTLTMDTNYGLRAKEQITLAGITVTGTVVLNGTWRIIGTASTNQITLQLAAGLTFTSATAGTWTRLAPHNTASMTKRIYRTATAADGTTNYYFVAEIPVATTTYDDAKLAKDLSGVIPSITWVMPPADLQGIISLPGGVHCGFSGNILCFSDPYHPYAWPTAYQLTSDYPIVGVGSFGQTVVVGTSGVPYLTSGANPAFMSMAKLAYAWPCLAKRGMVSFGGNVYFPTNEGLASIGQGGESIITAPLYSQVDWEALNPASFIAASYNNNYYAYHAGVAREVLAISAESGVVTMNIQPNELWTDPATGKLYAQYSGTVWDLNNAAAPSKTAAWVSKEYVFAKPLNFGAAKVDADFNMGSVEAAAIVAWNAAITASNAAILAAPAATKAVFNIRQFNTTPFNGSVLRTDTKALGGFVGLTLWANDAAVFSTSVYSSGMFRLPGGLKYDNAYIQVSSNVPVQSVCIAETPKGLARV